MTHLDPRDPRQADIDPLKADAPRPDPRPEPPLGDPRFERETGNRWMVIGAVAAALILVIVTVSMLSSSGVPTARAPEEQRPPVAEGMRGLQPPAASDPTTTGSVPPAQPLPPQTAPMQAVPPQTPEPHN
jgi:hypothetical protein